MITREWVAIHRKHHAKCETEEDPHSPMHKGIKTVFWRGVELYREARGMREDIEQYGKGAPNDWIERHLYTPHATMGPTAAAVRQLRAVRLHGRRGVGDPDGVDPVLGRGRGQRPRPLVGLSQLRDHRHRDQPDAVGRVDRRRGAAQQPPRVPELGEVRAAQVGVRHRLEPRSSCCEKLRLAKVLRVAPSLDVRPNINVPDSDTMRALLAHRFQAMTDYQRNVLTPALREEARAAGAKLRALLPRKLRKGIADDGRWLKPDARQQLQQWVAQRPRIRTLVEHRARLAALLEARTHNAAESLHNLQAWCREAEASGIRALQDYSARLKGYSLQPVRA